MNADSTLTFTTADDEITVDTTEAAPDDMVPLSLTSVLSSKSPGVQIV